MDCTKKEFASIRSGKASPNMLDTVRVEMYGSQLTMNQVATVSSPEPRLLIVTPFDKARPRRSRRRSASANWASTRRTRARSSACRSPR